MSSEFGSLLYHETNMQQITTATSNPAAYSTAPEEGAPIVKESRKRRLPYRDPQSTFSLSLDLFLSLALSLIYMHIQICVSTYAQYICVSFCYADII
jgi:hypothetical protein